MAKYSMFCSRFLLQKYCLFRRWQLPNDGYFIDGASLIVRRKEVKKRLREEWGSVM